MTKTSFSFFIVMSLFLGACNSDSSDSSEHNNDSSTDLTSKVIINNQMAYITSQCYTKTVDDLNGTHNPCFSCHINSQSPNFLDDYSLQEAYDFAQYSKVNRWTNLFKDRTEVVGAISDEEILNYIRHNNYIDANNTITLTKKLHSLPTTWDHNKNGIWDGYIPDCYFNFDTEGFDKNPQGEYTRWRAFAYYPFLGTFWPTNGSTDDVLIRLDELYFLDENATFDIEVAKLNYSIVEALIKQKDIAIDAVDEKKYGVDLNQNGTLDTATQIVFNWRAPTYNYFTEKFTGYTMWYVGKAKLEQEESRVFMGEGLYPLGTEFLHSVRYIDVDDTNTSVLMANRMKELRYAKKTVWHDTTQHKNFADDEGYERTVAPDVARAFVGDMEIGLDNGTGWNYQGFIEDAQGELRPQTYEETIYCMGCHSTIGAIKDSTFVFARKLKNDTFQNGWYHWKQHGLQNINEPQLSDGRYEYQLYLRANHAGDEFRDNSEIMEKFFDANSEPIASELAKIQNDISYLLFPSVQRALQLNKAYKVIVDEQSYIYGRDAHIKPVENVHKEVEIGQSTELEAIKR